LQRLARLAGEAAPAQEATALLFAGDPSGATALERRAETGWNDTWAPYLIAKARVMARRQKLGEAAEALDYVPHSWWARPTYWQARLDIARAAGDTAAAEQATGELRALTRSAWPGTAWTWQGDRARLEMLTGEPARGIEVDLAQMPAAGAVVELRLDGGLLGAFPARLGAPLALAFTEPLGPGLHVLTAEPVAGGGVTPGEVRLR
jgi:hypothetical protein